MKPVNGLPHTDATPDFAVQTMLVATDLTHHSRETVAYAEALARFFKARILLLHVIDPAFFWVFPLEGMAAEPVHINAQLSSQLSEVASGLRERGIDCEPVIREGNIRSEIRTLVREEDIDLLVLGAHRTGSLRQLAFGSTFNTIIHESTCPVLTVGPNALPVAGTEPYQFNRIVLAADFTAPSKLAASYAAALASAQGSSLSVAHVRTRTESRCTVERLKLSLNELVPELKPAAFTPILLDGDPVRALCHHARTERTDLIVMGVRHMSPAAVMLSEGIAHEVICCADCPVLTVAQDAKGHVVRPAFIEEIAGTLV